jgi:hypothetical protein
VPFYPISNYKTILTNTKRNIKSSEQTKITVMKKISLYLLATLLFSVSSCNNKTSENNTVGIETSDKETTTTFTVDGTAYKGKVSTQYFGSNKETDNFSVVCQQDEPLVLLQAVFANEKMHSLQD